MSSKLSGNGPAIETFVRLRDSGLFQGVSSSSSLSGAKRTPIIWPFTSARRTISSTPCRLILRIEDKNAHWSVWERIAHPGKRYYLILGTAAEEATRSGCRSRPPVACLDLERADRTNPDRLRGGVPWFS